MIRLASGNRYSKHVRHVVTQIVAPFGPPLCDRPPVPALEELKARKDEKHAAKAERRSARANEAMQRKVEANRLRRDKKRPKEAGNAGEAETGGNQDDMPYADGVRSDMVIEGSGGLHHPGKIHDRAMANSQIANRRREKAQENNEELKRTNERLEQMAEEGKEFEKTGTEKSKPEKEETESRGKGWFGWR